MKLNKMIEKSNECKKFISNGLCVSGNFFNSTNIHSRYNWFRHELLMWLDVVVLYCKGESFKGYKSYYLNPEEY